MGRDYTIGEIITVIRKNLGLSRKEFAARMKISANTLGRYERNETVPSCIFLVRLKLEFDIDMDIYQPKAPLPQLFSNTESVFSRKTLRDSYTLGNELPVLFAENKRSEYKIRQMNHIKEIKSLFYRYLKRIELRKKIETKRYKNKTSHLPAGEE